MSLKLTLNDDINMAVCYVNANVLSSKCEYFATLFTKFREKNLNEITMKVSNAHVMFDIVSLLNSVEYNPINLMNSKCDFVIKKCDDSLKIPEWKYQLYLVVNFDYLGIEFDINNVIKYDIPSENFDDLINTLDVVGYCDAAIKILAKNIPVNYDLSRIPHEILTRIVELSVNFRIASSDWKSIKIWNANSGELLKNVKKDCVGIQCFAVSPDGYLFASGNDDGKINVFDFDSLKILRTFDNYSCINSLIFVENTSLISQNRGIIKIHNINTGESTVLSEKCGALMGCVAISSNGKQVACACDDNSIKLINIHTGNSIKLIGHASWIKSIIFSPDSKMVASGSFDKKIIIWSSETGKILKTFYGHTSVIKSLCFSPDNEWIVSGSEDSTVKIWNIIDDSVLTLNDHIKSVNCVVYSTDGQKIISCSDDGKINIWDAQTGNLITTIKSETNWMFRICVSGTFKYSSHLIEKIMSII